jgi:hypothetical protein
MNQKLWERLKRLERQLAQEEDLVSFERVGKLLDSEKTGGVEARPRPAAWGSSPPPRSPEAAQRRIRELTEDPKGAYWNARHPSHADTVEHVRRLYEQAYPA